MAQATRGKSGHAHVLQKRWSRVAGNARRGNPRDANRDADAERLGLRSGVASWKHEGATAKILPACKAVLGRAALYLEYEYSAA